LKLTVVDADGDKKKGMMVLHPQSVFPCLTAR
jgi:hypothetical protein